MTSDRRHGALVPIMWSTGVGSDVMKPIAAPIIGGMITSTIHVVIITPARNLLHHEAARASQGHAAAIHDDDVGGAMMHRLFVMLMSALLVAACGPRLVRTPHAPPAAFQLNVSKFSHVWVAGFVAGRNPDIDVNVETVRFLRSSCVPSRS